jgi:hypothetical protein
MCSQVGTVFQINFYLRTFLVKVGMLDCLPSGQSVHRNEKICRCQDLSVTAMLRYQNESSDPELLQYSLCFRTIC